MKGKRECDRVYLTLRQAQVMLGMAAGLDRPQIAKQLGCTIKTVHNQVTRMREIFQASTNYEIIKHCFLSGCVEVPKDYLTVTWPGKNGPVKLI